MRATTLELPDGTQERIRELRALSERAEGGDQEARKELRRAVRESAPEVVARCSELARTYRRFLAKTASGKDPLVEEAFVRQAELLAAEVAGEDASALEVLLAERIASLWALTELQEALMSAYYGGNAKNLPPLLPHRDGQVAGKRGPQVPRRNPGAGPGQEAPGGHLARRVQHADKPRVAHERREAGF